MTIPAADTLAFQAQPASWSIEISSGVLDQAVFTDDYAGARGTIEIVDSVLPAFVGSAVLTIPSQAPDSSIYYSSVVYTDGRRLTTFQMDAARFTGSIRVEGASTDGNSNTEWYDVPFFDYKLDQTVESIHFDNSDERVGISVEGYHPYLRLSLDITDGNIDLITYR